MHFQQAELNPAARSCDLWVYDVEILTGEILEGCLLPKAIDQPELGGFSDCAGNTASYETFSVVLCHKKQKLLTLCQTCVELYQNSGIQSRLPGK